MRARGVTAAAAALLVLVAACTGDDAGAPADPGGPANTAPATAGPGPGEDDWPVQAPEQQGMDAATLVGAREYAFVDGRHTQGVVVVRNGVIVAEWYADGAGPDSWAASWSMAKSVTGALVGIAVAEGDIPSVDEPLATYYPHFAGTQREEITLRHVLQMASGLAFDEVYGDTGSDVVQMVLAERDQLGYAADRPSRHPPGTVFNYSSGDSQLLSGVIEQATGMSAEGYAQEKLFEPLGIDQVQWWQDAAGHTLTYCCLDTTSRDFARFGELYRLGGSWGDQQLVPAEWVAQSLTPSEVSDRYGYQWWLAGDDDPLPDLFLAQGHDGQFIYVVPSLDLVVVRNGTYIKYDGEPVADPNLFDRYPNSLRPELGTRGPETGWDTVAFLTPIVDSIATS